MCILTTSAIAGVMLNVIAVPIAGGIFFFFFLLCALSMGLLSVYFVELYPTSLRSVTVRDRGKINVKTLACIIDTHLIKS